MASSLPHVHGDAGLFRHAAVVPRRIEDDGGAGSSSRPARRTRHSPPSPACRPPPGSREPSTSSRWPRCGRRRCRPCRSGPAHRCRPGFPGRRRSSAPRRCRRSCVPARPAGWPRGSAHCRRQAWSRSRHRSSEYPPGRDKRFGQNINLFEGVVHGEGSAAGGGDTEALQQRLGAMGAGADGNARTVDHGGDVMGMRPVHGEGDDGALVPGPADRCAGC